MYNWNFGIASSSKERPWIFCFIFALFLVYWLHVLFGWCRSLLCGGSPAIFMFGYSIYFYARSNMSSFMQLSFFIGYNACMCYAFFLILGTISFRASLMFVRRIYQAVKSEWICFCIQVMIHCFSIFLFLSPFPPMHTGGYIGISSVCREREGTKSPSIL